MSWISVLYRRMYRRHPAERSGGDELRQTTVIYRCPRRAGQRADNADLSYSLPATAPPFPPVCAAAAVRQTGDDLKRPQGGSSWSGGGHVGPRRTSQGLIPSCLGGCNFITMIKWEHPCSRCNYIRQQASTQSDLGVKLSADCFRRVNRSLWKVSKMFQHLYLKT